MIINTNAKVWIDLINGHLELVLSFFLLVGGGIKCFDSVGLLVILIINCFVFSERVEHYLMRTNER
ncbi:hypothetical protein BLOT_013079 [Blomia tropicalis]|nr:hypothetical protein BLOT_013079 [Blomia tropicalis]